MKTTIDIPELAIENEFTEIKSSVDVIEILRKRLACDPALSDLLTKSLIQAKELAQPPLLDQALYDALKYWPTTTDEYLEYLQWFSTWTPNQYGEGWEIEGYDQNQEVYDRLCHFYWLIDQDVIPDGGRISQEVQNGPWFSKWLIAYADLWGSYLNTPESFNRVILESFIKKSPQYNVQDSMITNPITGAQRPNNPSGWQTFNQFFARELNPGLRPISSPDKNTVISCPADCTYKETFPITADSKIKEIIIKNTHKYASIEDLLKGSPYQDDFANGTYVHYFLGPYDYHRFHAPVSGKVLECRAIRGLTYLNVNITGDQFDAPDSGRDGYEFSQSRGVVILDTAESPYQNIGKVAIIPVGMCQVSSVNMTATINSTLLKGDEFGYFLFGGSDIIMLFQEGIDLHLDQDPVHHKYGTKVGSCTSL